MSKTVVGLFSSVAQAEQVKKTLVADGYNAQSIRVVANDEGSQTGSQTGSSIAATTDSGYTDIGSGGGTGIGEKISGFFRNLSGGDESVHSHYAAGVNSGGALLTATVEDAEAEEVAGTLREFGAKQIEGGSQATAQTTGTALPVAGTLPAYGATNTTAVTGETAIPIVEEELVVGKREVDRGGVRIYSHVVERPVDADINLREEHINVERRAVNRPATAADFAAGSGSVFELNATGEEAVVGKTSHVVEEVLVGKQSSERTRPSTTLFARQKSRLKTCRARSSRKIATNTFISKNSRPGTCVRPVLFQQTAGDLWSDQ